MMDLSCALIPNASAINTQFANDTALLKATIAENDVVDWRRSNELHEDKRSPVGFRDRLKEVGDSPSVNVVAAAFSLGLQHVILASLGVEGLLSSFETGITCVHGVNIGECAPQLSGILRIVADEFTQS
jgi:hypothetical protein